MPTINCPWCCCYLWAWGKKHNVVIKNVSKVIYINIFKYNDQNVCVFFSKFVKNSLYGSFDSFFTLYLWLNQNIPSKMRECAKMVLIYVFFCFCFLQSGINAKYRRRGRILSIETLFHHRKRCYQPWWFTQKSTQPIKYQCC